MRFGIIGYGRFGRLWADILSVQGEVFVYDKNITEEQHGGSINLVSLKEVVETDILFLLVPISEIESVCQEISSLLNPNTIVVDSASVKVHPATVMQKHLSEDQSIIATHPLFGPDSVKRSGLKGKKIVVDPVRATTEQKELLESIFKKMEIKIIKATAEEHDKQMANSQALVHFLGRALANLNLKNQEISTPDYQSLLQINDLVENDTWQLFVDMQKYNPYAGDVRESLVNELKKIEEKIIQA